MTPTVTASGVPGVVLGVPAGVFEQPATSRTVASASVAIFRLIEKLLFGDRTLVLYENVRLVTGSVNPLTEVRWIS
jgi:hypothetical protein